MSFFTIHCLKDLGMQLQIGDFIYKEAVWDELTVMDKKDYITKISVKCETKSISGKIYTD